MNESFLEQVRLVLQCTKLPRLTEIIEVFPATLSPQTLWFGKHVVEIPVRASTTLRHVPCSTAPAESG